MQRPAAPQGTVFAGLTGTSSGTASRTTASPITITKSDYDAFERLLGDIQSAFSAEDLPALRGVLTPEMLSYFSEQLADNASRGLINRVEGSIDYATVAMKYALKDSMVERASGRVVQGGERTEVTELWTFRRARGGNWLLSAIQQT
jgi:predicted lipid-binding transport protein (Tim44 family)